MSYGKDGNISISGNATDVSGNTFQVNNPVKEKSELNELEWRFESLIGEVRYKASSILGSVNLIYTPNESIKSGGEGCEVSPEPRCFIDRMGILYRGLQEVNEELAKADELLNKTIE